MSDSHFEIDRLLGVQPSPQRKARNAAPPIPLDAGRKHVRHVKRRVFHNAARTKRAAEALAGLPAIGETWHVIMAGAYDSFDLIDAMLEHASPAKIEALHLATLGFNSANATRLIAMLDAGDVGRCTMLVSTYYESDHKERDTCYRLAAKLPEYGGWYCATRSHCKIIAARMTDGRCYVIESSANLRSCRNLEQFTISQDVGLFAFHVGWMEEARANAEKRRSDN